MWTMSTPWRRKQEVGNSICLWCMRREVGWVEPSLWHSPFLQGTPEWEADRPCPTHVLPVMTMLGMYKMLLIFTRIILLKIFFISFLKHIWMLDFNHRWNLQLILKHVVTINSCECMPKNTSCVTRTVCVFKVPMCEVWQLMDGCRRPVLFQVPPRNHVHVFQILSVWYWF